MAMNDGHPYGDRSADPAAKNTRSSGNNFAVCSFLSDGSGQMSSRKEHGLDLQLMDGDNPFVPVIFTSAAVLLVALALAVTLI
jgi:hypothetical protein